MVVGITGNTNKEAIWEPVSRLVAFLEDSGREYVLNRSVATGLANRLPDLASAVGRRATDALGNDSNVVLSFGGDGTLLNTAHEIGDSGTPILGVNLGRLGFLASLEESQLVAAIKHLETEQYRVEHRFVLEASAQGVDLPHRWALNEFVVQRSGDASLIAIDVAVDGTALNTYWADGLLLATPTGSTAYNLAVGGPIVVPTSETILVTPVAPHTLTVRPVVLPGNVTIDASVRGGGPFVFTSDGRGTVVEDGTVHITVRRAAHTVNLVQMPDEDFFQTLRTKLMWGARKV